MRTQEAGTAPAAPGQAAPRHPLDPEQRARAIRRVLWITLGLNLSVAAAKLIAGYLTATLSLLADGFHSLFDGSSNVLGLIAMHVAAREPDEGHPYGHRKFEAFGAMAIGFLLLATAWQVGSMLVDRLLRGSHPEYSPASFLAVLFTIAVNIFVTRYERREGERWRSDLLIADSQHTRSDVFASAAVLTTLVSVAYGLWWPDIGVSAGIMLLIVWTALGIFRTNLGVLVDASALDDGEVARAALAVPGVVACHRVRSRGPSDHVHLDLHIHVPPEMTIEQAHEVTHQVEDRLRDQFPQLVDVVIHTEPSTTPPHLD